MLCYFLTYQNHSLFIPVEFWYYYFMATTACSLTSYSITLLYWGTDLFLKRTWLILPHSLAIPIAWNAFLWVCTHHTPSSFGLTVISIKSSCWDLNPGSLATEHPTLNVYATSSQGWYHFFFLLLKSSTSGFLKLKNQPPTYSYAMYRIIVPLGLFKVMTSLRRLFP